MRLRSRNRFSLAGLVLFLLGTVFSTVLLAANSQTAYAAGEIWAFTGANTMTVRGGAITNGTITLQCTGGQCRTTQAVRFNDGQVCNINVNSITKNTTSPNGGYTGRVALENGVQCNSQSNILGTTTIGIADPSGVGPGGGNAPGGGGGPAGGGGANADDDAPSCEEEGGSMSWIICPIVEMLDDAIEKLDREIQNLLEIPDSYLSDDLEATWARLRNIAYIILVPIMLVMVIGTALGFEFFSAYTVKRALPRMIFATIFIALSWSITTFMVEFFNAVGRGTMGLLTSSFAGSQDITLSSIVHPSGLEVPGGIFAGLIAGGAAVLTGFLSVGIILSYAFLAFMLLLLGFLILVFRQMLIILLVVLAPLAILAWIFPGNDRLWKLWWGTFTKLLMMFPIIAGMIAMGKVFAYLIDTTQGAAVFVSLASFASFLDPTNLMPFAQAPAPPPSTAFTFMKMTAYLIPYALLYKVPAWVGGFFGAMTGAFQDKTRGLIDRNKKFRQNQRAQGWQSFKSGERGMTQQLRTFGAGVGAFTGTKNKGSFLFNRGYRREAMSQQHKMNEMAYGGTDRAKATQEDDGMLRAQTYRTEAEARRRMAADFGMSEADVDRSINAVRATGGWSKQRQNYATRRLAHTGTGYDNIEQMQNTVARVAGDNRSMAFDMLGEMNAVTKGVGRHDLAAGFSNQTRYYENIQARIARGDADPGMTREEAREATTIAARDIDPVTMLRDKPRAVTNMSIALNESFHEAERAAAGGDADAERQRAILGGYINKLEQSGTYASATTVEEARQHVVAPTSGAGSEINIPSPNPSNTAGIDVPTAGRAALGYTSRVQTRVNPVSQRMEVVYEEDPANPGHPLIDPDTNRPIPVQNPHANEPTSDIAQAHGPRARGADPYDQHF